MAYETRPANFHQGLTSVENLKGLLVRVVTALRKAFVKSDGCLKRRPFGDGRVEHWGWVGGQRVKPGGASKQSA